MTPRPSMPTRLSGGPLLRRAARMVLGLADRLPYPRDEALIGIAKQGYALVTGRPAPSGVVTGTHHEPRVDAGAIGRARAALDEGDLDTARARIDELAERHPTSVRVLRLRREILSKQGALTELARTLAGLNLLEPTEERLAQERTVLGRLVETTPGWLPRIPGPPHPVDPEPGVVLHLLKESVPYLQNGFTMRSRYSLLAQRSAGLSPVVVTQLGFPRTIGVDEPPALEVVDGIPHHRLDLGPHYPADRPWDLLLTDQAWLTARLARTIRPEIIHASSGHRGYESALVGLALRDHLVRPLVYEVRSFFESTWSGDLSVNERGEQYERRYATESRAMQAADHVITIAEAMRDDIAARGVDPARIAVVPNGVDATAFTPEPPDPDLRYRLGARDRFVFGYVSNLDHPREGQEVLIEATARLAARGRDVHCLIVGDGKRRSELEALARSSGAGDRVAFTGRVPHDEVRRHYAVMDAFIVPRRDERAARTVTPLKPYEAMAMERPLVVADLPPLLEITEPDARGLTFRAGDAESLAATIERLMDDGDLRARIARAGREWVVREQSWEANGPRYRAVYDEVLERWAAAARRAG